ncbi:hypothetical protein ACFXTH_032646 [Malus domestica]
MPPQMKIVVKVPMDCDKCKTKALTIAAAAHGVSKVSIEGANKDLVEVIGDDVDSFCLTRSLRKKLGCSCALVKVEKVKPAVKTVEKPTPTPSASYVQNCCICTPHFRPMYCELVHEYPEPTTCFRTPWRMLAKPSSSLTSIGGHGGGGRRRRGLGRLRLATDDSPSTDAIADDYYAVLGLLPDATEYGQRGLRTLCSNAQQQWHLDVN